MTITAAAARAGVTPQAIYKQLKKKGISPADLKAKDGELTAEGERIIADMFPRKAADTPTQHEKKSQARETAQTEEEPAGEHTAQEEAPARDNLQKEVDALKENIRRLETEVNILQERARLLTEERDYLRKALDQSQQLQAMTAAKIPNPTPAITDGSGNGRKRGLFSWLRRKDSGIQDNK